MMRRELNIRRATGASPTEVAPEPNLIQLLEQAAGKARAARDIADSIEQIEHVTWDDLADISNLCGEVLRLLKDAKTKTGDEPTTPTPTLALVPRDEEEVALAA